MLLIFVSMGCPQQTTLLTHEAIGCLQKHDAFEICVDRMPAKNMMLLIFVSIGCQQKTTFLTYEAIGCQQKHDAFDICVDRMPAKNDTFNI